MTRWLEKLIVRLWNRSRSRRTTADRTRGIDLGVRCLNGDPVAQRVSIPQNRRAEHVAVLGKTGTGKSSLLRYLAAQDIASDRGFIYFDLHGDATHFLVATVANRERVLKKDLSDRLIVIEPADGESSVGLNPLETASPNDRFVQIAEFAQVLRERWHLDSFGARTDELLRNSLHVIAENGFTLLELSPLLSHAAFRAECLKKVSNPEVTQYFEMRYGQVSEAMRGVMREPILNKTSQFTSDRHFRHIVGQQRSTFSVLDALEQGYWVILNLHKGRLGEQSLTLGSLFLSTIKHALFARKRRELFTLYADEIQNLVAFGNGLETMLSESRKFAVSVTSANQFLDQYPAEMRAAILAVGSQVFFQLSSLDAQQIAAALDGGKPLAELLKNLPRRHMVAKVGHERWAEAVVPVVDEPKIDPADLLARSRARWARNRNDIEEEIRRRQAIIHGANKEALDDWE